MQQPDLTRLLQLAQSPAGRQLLELLQKNGGEQLRSAANQASSGDYAAAQKTLSPLLDSPEIRSLLQQLGGNP